MSTEAWAELSVCGLYRYKLGRVVVPEIRRTLAFMMLNPSTADATDDDPTIKRCMGFVRTLGFGQLEVVNLFPLRSKTPKALKLRRDALGPPGANASRVADVARRSDALVLAWGAKGDLHGMAERYIRAFAFNQDFHDKLWVLGETQAGQPRHPLFLPKDAKLIRPSWWRKTEKT